MGFPEPLKMRPSMSNETGVFKTCKTWPDHRGSKLSQKKKIDGLGKWVNLYTKMETNTKKNFIRLL